MNMTVQEMINKLNLIENKSLNLVVMADHNTPAFVVCTDFVVEDGYVSEDGEFFNHEDIEDGDSILTDIDIPSIIIHASE